MATRVIDVGPDAGVPIKPVFGLMGWRCPRLGGRAPARPDPWYKTWSHKLPWRALKPSYARLSKRGVCPYANFAATGLEAGDKLGREDPG